MSKPEAGQWWETEFGRIYVVGPMDEGTASVVHNEAGFMWTVSPEKFEAWTHLVNCTGWDWVVPEEQPATPRSQEPQSMLEFMFPLELQNRRDIELPSGHRFVCGGTQTGHCETYKEAIFDSTGERLITVVKPAGYQTNTVKDLCAFLRDEMDRHNAFISIANAVVGGMSSVDQNCRLEQLSSAIPSSTGDPDECIESFEATWLDCLFAVICLTAVAFCYWKAVTSDCEAVPSKSQDMP